ncbi:MAG: sugar ABC transporter permease [Candidatus Hydrogenedentota bacterium]
MNTTELKRMRILFLLPAFILFTVFAAIPGVRALIYSLQKWDGLGDAEWVGDANFRALFADTLFIEALKNNLILMIGGGTITLAVALTFASLIHRGIRGAGLFRIAFFFPNIIAAVAVAMLWSLMYSTTEFGVINGVLGGLQDLFGIEDGPFPFAFTDSKYLIWSLVPMLVWTATGFYMVLFLAAMQSIPEEFYEAATLEGASNTHQFWHITMPLIREVFVVGVVFFIISSAKFFDAVWVIESQVPNQDSHVLATVLYQKVFTEYNVGYAAAVGVVLFAMVFVATLITLRFSRKDALEY